MREIVHIQLGQAGNNIGTKVKDYLYTTSFLRFGFSFGKLFLMNMVLIPQGHGMVTQICSSKESMFISMKLEVEDMYHDQ